MLKMIIQQHTFWNNLLKSRLYKMLSKFGRKRKYFNNTFNILKLYMKNNINMNEKDQEKKLDADKDLLKRPSS